MNVLLLALLLAVQPDAGVPADTDSRLLPPQPSGTADIQLDVRPHSYMAFKDGRAVERQQQALALTLRHAKVVRYVDRDGNRQLRFLFSPRPIDDVRLADRLGNHDVLEWAERSGSPYIFILEPRGNEEQFQVISEPLGEIHADDPFPESSIGTDHVTGTVRLTSPGHFHWNLRGTFAARLSEVHAAEPITGASLLASPQGLRLLGFMTALERRKLWRLRPHVTIRTYHRIKALEREHGPDGFNRLVETNLIEPARLEQMYASGAARLYVGDGQARIELDVPPNEGSDGVYHLKLEYGRWLVD